MEESYEGIMNIKTCEGSLLDRKSSGTRIVGVGIRFAGVEEIFGFFELQEPPGDTQLAARRHSRGAWCFDSRITLFFVLFTQQ